MQKVSFPIMKSTSTIGYWFGLQSGKYRTSTPQTKPLSRNRPDRILTTLTMANLAGPADPQEVLSSVEIDEKRFVKLLTSLINVVDTLQNNPSQVGREFLLSAS